MEFTGGIFAVDGRGGFDHRLRHLTPYPGPVSNDVLYPLLIAAACAIVVYLVHRLTRPKPSLADIALPSTPSNAAERPSPHSELDPTSSLASWHSAHEGALLDYFEHYDAMLASPDHATEHLGVEADADLSAAFESAYSAHPAPDMRAELAATRTAADAMALAKERGDDTALERHRDVYRQYRAAWLERLWQFAGDRNRIARLRRDGLPA